MGAVGARFEKPGKMEFVHMIVDSKQNTKADSRDSISLLTDR